MQNQDIKFNIAGMPDDAASIDLQISDRLWNGISRRGDTNKKWTGENTNPFRVVV
jgi:hypothetical protein